MEKKTCSFCGQDIEPGTGRTYCKRDSTVYHFCSTKCYKNQIVLKRVPRHTKWSKKYLRT